MSYIPNHNLNCEHAINPQIGDYWHEMLVPIAVIVNVNSSYVTFCDTRVRSEKSWIWDFHKLQIVTREEFSNLFRYGKIRDEKFQALPTDDIQNKFWCDVWPQKHIEFVDEFREIAHSYARPPYYHI